MKLTINCDLDGVVVDFNTEMQEMTEVTLGNHLPTFDIWRVWEIWGMTLEEWQLHFNRNVMDGMFGRCREIPGAVKAVLYLTLDHRVRFITNKSLQTSLLTQKAQQDTSGWLGRRDLLQGTELIFTKDKQGYPADVVIDDKPNLDWAQRGAHNLLFDSPWNEDVETVQAVTKFGVGVTRVAGWQGVIDYVDDVAGRVADGG